MELTLLLDHRFFCDTEGIAFSVQNYNYELFAKRYLRVFECVHVVARVSNQPLTSRKGRRVSGPGVHLHSVGSWHGLTEFIFQRRSVSRRLNELLSRSQAVIMIAPSTISSMAYERLLADGRPFGVEVISNPATTFAPGVIEHPLRPLFQWWFKRRLRQQCAEASAVAYVTENALQKGYPPSDDAFSTHYSSIELLDNAFVVKPRSSSLKGDSFRIVSVGSLQQPYKGADVLLEAVRRTREYDLNVSLVWVGGGQYQLQLEAQAQGLGIAEQVQFVGQTPAGDSVRAYLDEADLFVLPSRTEGLPRAMIEAMARGLPCVGTNVGGIPELLTTNNMVSPDDSKALAYKIIEVANDPHRLAQMSARNLRKAKEYRVDVLQERRDELYSFLRDRTVDWLEEMSS